MQINYTFAFNSQRMAIQLLYNQLWSGLHCNPDLAQPFSFSLPLVSIVDYFWLTCTGIELVVWDNRWDSVKRVRKYTNIMYSSCGLHANTARVGNRITRKWRVSTSRIPRWTILQTLIKTHDIRFVCIGTSQSSWWGIQCANAYTCHICGISTNFLWDVREILYIN